jgi:hypothetical protein
MMEDGLFDTCEISSEAATFLYAFDCGARYVAGNPASGRASRATPSAGCGSGPRIDGPLGRSASRSGSQCFWTSRNGVGTFGLLSFGNSGGPVRLDKVTLAGAHQLRIVAAWVVPITGTDLLGVFNGYPPNGDKGSAPPLSPGVQWRHRQRVAGAVIPHIRGRDAMNLVLVLKPSGRQGTVRSEYIYYHSASTRYLLNPGVGIQLFNGDEHGR